MSEEQRPVGETEVSVASHQLNRREVAEAAPLYRIAYEASQRSLDDQLDELNRIRDRAVQFVVFVGAATAFLIGTGLKAPVRDSLFYVLASIGSLLSVAAIVLLFLLLNPHLSWSNRISARRLMSDWIEPQVPQMSEGDLLRALAGQYDDYRAANERLLGVLRFYYRSLIILGSVQVVVWAALVWARA
jgi:hypothetical protein